MGEFSGAARLVKMTHEVTPETRAVLRDVQATAHLVAGGASQRIAAAIVFLGLCIVAAAVIVRGGGE